MTLILGLNAYHADSSACIVKDGALLAAAEEERFRRIKHWAGLPVEAVRYCLAEAGATLADVDHIAINRDPKAHFLQKALFAFRQRPSFALIRDRLANAAKVRSPLDELASALNVPRERVRAKLHAVEHHLAHLASAFFVSPFEEAAVVSVDGFGDFLSAMWGVGRGTEIEVKGRVFFPHSLGLFYQAITQYLGFWSYGDEYKVMGFAPYGRPTRMAEMERIVHIHADGTYSLGLEFFRHHAEGVEMIWQGGYPEVGRIFSPALEELLGPARAKDAPLEERHADIAASAQAMYERAFFHLLDVVQRESGLNCLCLAGGCALNSVANGKVYRRTRFRRLYMPPAAGDAGGAIGAAFVVWHQLLGNPRSFVMDRASWGPGWSDDELARFVANHRAAIEAQGCRITQASDDRELVEHVAAAIAKGAVVGWFQGRMEWGPRALGNRSILADPRRPDMKDILNLKIKRRESFRPFAPAILRERVAAWFEEEDDVPFMMQVFQVRPEKRGLIPATTHVDGSGRLQTVTRDANPRYYDLITAFEKKTGIPILLNTSFNENEPIVCRPEEALDCFLRTKMDLLVLGRTILAREEGAAEHTTDARS